MTRRLSLRPDILKERVLSLVAETIFLRLDLYFLRLRKEMCRQEEQPGDNRWNDCAGDDEYV